MAEWHKIFYVGATVYLASGVVFCAMGTGKTQPWNNLEVKKGKDEKAPEGLDNKAFDQVEENTKV